MANDDLPYKNLFKRSKIIKKKPSRLITSLKDQTFSKVFSPYVLKISKLIGIRVWKFKTKIKKNKKNEKFNKIAKLSLSKILVPIRFSTSNDSDSFKKNCEKKSKKR